MHVARIDCKPCGNPLQLVLLGYLAANFLLKPDLREHDRQ